MKEPLESLLMQIGMSGLESEVYLALLSEPGSTGYRISQILGKAAPNTYKALDSLVAKGAAIADVGGRSRTFAAVPVSELAAQESHRLESLASRIEKGLEGIERPQTEVGLYRLTTVHQVIVRARKMLREASLSIVVDADPGPMDELMEGFTAAADRGVKVLLHGRREMEVPGCEHIASVTEGWSGDLLVLVVDGDQYLIAFMSSEMRTLVEAVWSRNFLAACLDRGYTVKALFYRLSMMIGDGRHSIDEVRSELVRLWDDWGYEDRGKEALTKILRSR